MLGVGLGYRRQSSGVHYSALSLQRAGIVESRAVLTPTAGDVPADAAVLGEDGDKEQRVQVQSLDEDPRVVGRRRVVEQHHHQTTAPPLYTAHAPP